MNKRNTTFDQLISVGINHWKAPVEVREKFSLSDQAREAFLDEAAGRGYADIIALSTCNRSELLFMCDDPGELIDLFLKYSNGSWQEFETYGFTLRGREAADHFFKVAVGLDAQILGDLQIIKQVKEAYEHAHKKNMIGGTLHRLVQSMFRAHKRSRNETDLASGAATTAYAAVQYARHHMQSLSDKKIVLVGTGKIGKVTCKNLMSHGARNVTLVNRSRNRAEKLGDRFELPSAGFEDLKDLILDADVVIVATGADSPIINDEVIPQNLNGKQRIMLDLSVPRNIDPALDSHPSIEVVNMDMINETTDEAYRKREENIPKVEAIISEELDAFSEWLDEQHVVPTIKALDAKLEDIRQAELERYRNRTDQSDLDRVDELTRRITKKILAHSIDHIKQNREDPESATRVIEEMFKLEQRKIS